MMNDDDDDDDGTIHSLCHGFLSLWFSQYFSDLWQLFQLFVCCPVRILIVTSSALSKFHVAQCKAKT